MHQAASNRLESVTINRNLSEMSSLQELGDCYVDAGEPLWVEEE